MIQQQRQPDVQTLESTELSRLLDRPYMPRRKSAIIKSPPENLWDRWQIITYLWRSWRFVPNPNLDIEFGTIFYNQTVPTTGKCYVKCGFIGCDLEKPTGHYEIVGSLIEGGQLYSQLADFGWCKFIGNIVPSAGTN